MDIVTTSNFHATLLRGASLWKLRRIERGH